MTIPPGLTCGRCELSLAPALARIDGETYVHADRCPCTIEGCDDRQHGHGYCRNHSARFRKHGHPLGGVVIETEDVEWMVETGETFEGAAARLGTSVKSLDSVLRRRGRADLIAAFRREVVAA